MAVNTDIVKGFREVSNIISGGVPAQAGRYYTQIYSTNAGESTGVPTLTVQMHDTAPGAPARPVPLRGMSNEAVINTLRVERSGEGYRQEVPQSVTDNAGVNGYVEAGGGIGVAGLTTLVILLGLVGFVYFIIRMWQERMMQHQILSAGSTNKAPLPDTLPLQQSQPNTAATPTTYTPPHSGILHWRDRLAEYDRKLHELLERHGVVGETISEKLKALHGGEFKSADIAWEAHQTAKRLLGSHDSEIKDEHIGRAERLFKQVFSDHGVGY